MGCRGEGVYNYFLHRKKVIFGVVFGGMVMYSRYSNIRVEGGSVGGLVSVSVEGDDSYSLLFDRDTGEVRYVVRLLSDIGFPEMREEYRKSIDQLDLSKPGDLEEWIGDTVYRLSQDVGDVVMDNTLSDKELRVLLYVGSRVVGQNIVFVLVKDIMRDISMNASQVSKALHGLERGKYITLEHRNTFGVGSRVIGVNPRYFWKGNYGVREIYQVQWWGISAERRQEILYSCPLLSTYYTR